MRVAIAYIISQVSRSSVFEWTATLLNREKYRLVFILMHSEETYLEQFLRDKGFEVYRVNYKNKYDLPFAIINIRRILKKEKIKIIHTHLFEGGLAGMTAAKLAGIPKRIHTRHDATIHHEYHPQAVKYDKITNSIATHLVAVTKNVKNILTMMEDVPENKITVIHHGFKIEEFEHLKEGSLALLKKKYFPDKKPYPVIGIVSRFIEWKGIQYIIPAFIELRKKYPSAHLVLANAQGPYSDNIDKLLSKLPASSFTKISFEADIISLFHLFDIFVHTPVDAVCEAFGQVYIEAMAAGIPSVVTPSGIAPDFIIDRVHAILVPFRNSDAITSGMEELLENDVLRSKIRVAAKEFVRQRFQIDKMIHSLENLYDN